MTTPVFLKTFLWSILTASSVRPECWNGGSGFAQIINRSVLLKEMQRHGGVVTPVFRSLSSSVPSSPARPRSQLWGLSASRVPEAI